MASGMPVMVGLTTEEMDLAYELAEERVAAARARGIKSSKVSPERQIDLDYQGVLGELAVRKWLRLPLEVNCSGFGDRETGDLTLPRLGFSVEVKFTRTRNGRLICPGDPLRIFGADLAILVFPWNKGGSLNPLALSGWVFRHKFRELARRYDFPYGKCWGMECFELDPIYELGQLEGVYYG